MTVQVDCILVTITCSEDIHHLRCVFMILRCGLGLHLSDMADGVMSLGWGINAHMCTECLKIIKRASLQYLSDLPHMSIAKIYLCGSLLR